MSKRSQVFEIIRLVTLLMGGLGPVSAVAQAPTFSAPSLPPIPGLPPLPNAIPAPVPAAPGIVAPPKLDTEFVPNPSNPTLSDLTTVPSAISTPKTETPSSDALADLPAPAAPESSDVVAPLADTAAPAAPESGDMAGVILPTTPGNADAPPPFPMPGLALPAPPASTDSVAPATALPDIDVADEAPKHKSWETRLAPTSFVYNTKFNYRRVQLPGSIFRAQYTNENQHLPTRITREDYVKLLFENAATNNIDGTRALLNAGTDINSTNPRGETPLQVARRFGARDTAALLAARGAH